MPRTKKKRENSNTERLYLKKIGPFPYDPAPITNILSSFTDLKAYGNCQLHNVIVSAASHMFKEVAMCMQ